MKTLALFFALSLCAAAQTMVGLPEHGITLVGSLRSPIIVNNSGQGIIALTIKFADKNGRGPVSTEYFFHASGMAIPYKGEKSLHGLDSGIRSPLDIITASLDNVVLGDGSFVGPDTTHGFDEMNMTMAVTAQAAGVLFGPDKVAAWTKLRQDGLNNFAVPAGEDGAIHAARRNAAFALITAQREGGDGKADKLARQLIALPALRRVVQ